MNFAEEVAFLRSELLHERKLVAQARQVALDLASILAGVMRDGIPDDLKEVFDRWEREETKRNRKPRGKQC